MHYLHYFIVNVLERIGSWYRSPAASEPENILPFDNPRGLPPPQFSWLLLGLLHYYARQRWARHQYIERIHSFGLSDMVEPVSGIVPGLPEWRYNLDHEYSFLTNRTTGEKIQIDSASDRDLIRSDIFLEYIQNHREPGAAEQKLRELFPGGKGMSVALDCLETFGVFHTYEFYEFGGMECRLRAWVRRHAQPVEAFLKAWLDTKNHLQLGVVIGDWPVVQHAAEANNQPEIAASAKMLAAQSRRRWLSRLCVAAEDGQLVEVVHAMAVVQAEDLAEYLERCLANPWSVKTAIEIIGDDASWRSRLESVFHKPVTVPVTVHTLGSSEGVD